MFKEAEKAILKHFQSEWTSTDVEYDNTKYTPVSGSPWIRLQIEWSDVVRVSISSKSRKGFGFVLASVFIPSNNGALSASGYADDIANIFDDWESGGLRFKVSKIKRVGHNGGWYQINVTCPFWYTECTIS